VFSVKFVNYGLSVPVSNIPICIASKANSISLLDLWKGVKRRIKTIKIIDKGRLMKSAFVIIIMITLLIVGMLVIKNYNTGFTEDTATKREAIDMGKEAAAKANEAAQKIKDINKQLSRAD
jgi:hypothetical protein